MSMPPLPPDGRRLAWHVCVAPTVRRLERLTWHIVWFALVLKVLFFS